MKDKTRPTPLMHFATMQIRLETTWNSSALPQPDSDVTLRASAKVVDNKTGVCYDRNCNYPTHSMAKLHDRHNA